MSQEPPSTSSSFAFFSGVADDGEPPCLVTFAFCFLGVVDDSKPFRFIVISLYFSQVSR